MSPFSSPGSGRKVKTLPKVLAAVGGVGLLLLFGQFAMTHGWIPTPSIAKALVPSRAVLPPITEAKVANVQPVAMPTTDDADVSANPIIAEEWEWNGQMAFNYANGGKHSTRGSLMEKHGVNLTIKRQDDTGQMMTDLVTCAQQLAGGAESCSQGANFILVMGDQTGALFGGLNPKLKSICSDCTAEVVGVVGSSFGEDKLMGPRRWKDNPKSMLGDGLIAAACREGDWNIVLKYEGDNSLPNNPDEKTFDPTAVNWLCSPDYIKAGEAYLAGDAPDHGVCEKRKEVISGRPTGKTVDACVRGVATWTPVDATIAQNKGGLVSVVSSREYRSQMPDVLVGIKKFDEANRKEITEMLAATFEAADQIRAFPTALHKAGAVSADIYGDQDADYWVKYYNGVQETDKQGLRVDLGGSKTANLADNVIWFGLKPGTNNNFKSTYTVFGRIVSQQYPAMIPKVPDYEEIANTSFVKDLARGAQGGAAPDVPTFTYASTAKTVVSKKSWHINFDIGQDTLTSSGESQLEQLKDDLAIAGGLQVLIDGYTDNTGSSSINRDLSNRRANAVRKWLKRTAPTQFPDQRFRVAGHGPDNPVASNTTETGRAQNRRVDITLAE